MLKTVKHWLKRLLRNFVRVQVRGAAALWDDPEGLEALGTLFALMREGEHRVIQRSFREAYSLHPSVQLYEDVILQGTGKILIGKDTYLSRHCCIVSNPATAVITIGEGCAIAENVQIRTEGYDPDADFRQARTSVGVSKDITIGNYVWLGANVFVCGGVTIGEDTVVGANSVVTSDLPPHSVCGGAPARVIRAKRVSGLTRTSEEAAR